jgi:hypothetical protein
MTAVLALWLAAADQGYLSSALVVVARHRRGPLPAFRSLPVRRDLPANAQPNHRDHAGPMHAGISTCVAKIGALPPYRCARAVLSEFLPLNDQPAIETVHPRTLHVGARLEKEAIVSSPTSSTAAQSITLSIDGGHVRSVRSYQMRSFEILLAQVGNDDGKQVVFSSMPAEADRQREQLRWVLQGLGATPSTPVTILSDGAAGPRSLGEAASLGPTRHVLDWFHLAMRIQHAVQAPKGWPDASAADRPAGAALADTASVAWSGQAGSGSHRRNGGDARGQC